MITLQTPYGDCYVLDPAQIVSVSPTYTNPMKKGADPTRQIIFASGSKLTVADTLENLKALLGADYSPPAVVPKQKGKKAKAIIQEE